MKRRRRLNYADVYVTLVNKLKPTKAEPNRVSNMKVVMKKQVVIGDTALECMLLPQKTLMSNIKLEHGESWIVRIDFVQIRTNVGKTNYEL